MRPFSHKTKSPAVNIMKYVKICQKPKHNRGFIKRGPLIIPPVLDKYVLSENHGRSIRLLSGARSKGTMGSYNRALVKFENFCILQNKDLRDISASLLKTYFDWLDETYATYSQVAEIKGAITYLRDALEFKDCWSPSVQRSYDSIHRRAAMEKPPVRKAPTISLMALENAVKFYTYPCFGGRQVYFFIRYKNLHSFSKD